MGSQDNNLYRRHAHSGRNKRGGESTPGSVAVPPGSPRVHCQSREVIPGPNTGTGIPWVVCGLAESPTQTPWREDQTDSQRCNTDANEGFSVSSTPFIISGQAQRSISCNVSRSLILPSLAEGSPKSSYRREPRLRTWDKAIQRVERRTGSVATSSHSLEREDNDSEASSDSDLVRCLPNRLGCSVRWCEYRSLMVPTGANNVYQLPGTSGYGIGNENLLEGSSRSLSVTAAGQLLCSSIHQQSWGDCVIISDLSGKISVAVGPRERHCLDSPAYSRGAQQGSRLRVKASEDRTDWMLAHQVFQKINQIFGPLEVDLFVSRLTHQLPRFFSWRPDPLAEATDAFQQDWRRVRGYANPPW